MAEDIDQTTITNQKDNLKNSNGLSMTWKMTFILQQCLKELLQLRIPLQMSFKKLHYIKDIFNEVEKPIYILERLLSF